jgi:predicted regulator of Ras-like GTPase activity (Roadblock/LC7/MglB family)
MSNTMQLTAEQTERSVLLLEQFLATSPDFIIALLSTVDGRLMLERSRQDIGGGRVASMAGSLIALSEALGGELAMKPCSHVTVSTQAGVIVALRVNDDRQVLALTTAARPGVNLGTLLASSRRTAAGLSQVASAAPAVDFSLLHDPD